MKRSMEFSGRSVDEAIFHGLNEMGVTIDEVEIQTLQSETKGLFGIGSKMAVVRLTERETPLVAEFEKPEPRERAPRTRGEGRPQRSGYGDRGGRNERRSDGRGERRERTSAGEEDELLPVPAVQYDYSAEKAESCPSARFLSELLAKMGVEGKVLAAETEDGLRLCIDADSNGLLIGRRGETLDAMQYIVSLFANKERKEEGYLRVTLDTEGYRARREDTLRRLAQRNASRVRATGRPLAMEPMNPYERRVLHSALQSYPGVTTHSEGEEPNRRVVISPSR